MTNEEKAKRNILGECGYISSKSKKMIYPDVFCDKACQRCAWNPKEKERRLKQGHWVEAVGFITKDEIRVEARKVRRLVFRRAVNG